MKKITTLILILAFTVNYSQIEFQQNGSPNFKIFWNYHNDFTKDVTKKSEFELKRVYLGYKYNLVKISQLKLPMILDLILVEVHIQPT